MLLLLLFYFYCEPLEIINVAVILFVVCSTEQPDVALWLSMKNSQKTTGYIREAISSKESNFYCCFVSTWHMV